MQARPFPARLAQELSARREKNARYSLRAFAAFLGVDHSTLSQILRGARRSTARQIRAWSRRLNLDAEEAACYILAEQLPGAATTARLNQLRHWTAEAMAIVEQPAHWEILRLSRTPEFHADCRWIGAQIGATVDQVNLALSRLLRLGLLELGPDGAWRDRTGLDELTRPEFRKLALQRVRESAGTGGTWAIQ